MRMKMKIFNHQFKNATESFASWPSYLQHMKKCTLPWLNVIKNAARAKGRSSNNNNNKSKTPESNKTNNKGKRQQSKVAKIKAHASLKFYLFISRLSHSVPSSSTASPPPHFQLSLHTLTASSSFRCVHSVLFLQFVMLVCLLARSPTAKSTRSQSSSQRESRRRDWHFAYCPYAALPPPLPLPPLPLPRCWAKVCTAAFALLKTREKRKVCYELFQF